MKLIRFCILTIFFLFAGITFSANNIDNPDEHLPGKDYLKQFAAKLAGYHTFDSFLVAVDNKIIYEQYFNGYSADKYHMIQSSTKSITSILIGILYDEGKLSLDETIGSLYPEQAIVNPILNQITIENLLTMSSGLTWNEMVEPLFLPDGKENPANDDIRMNYSGNWVEYVLTHSKTLAFKPGSKFDYNSGNSILLGDIIKKKTGLNAAVFAKKALFSKLGIFEFQWVLAPISDSVTPNQLKIIDAGDIKDNDERQVHTGGGLLLRPRDMVKIGELMLNGGVYNGKKVLSAKWVEMSLTPYLQIPKEEVFYGFQWWRTILPNGHKMCFSAGVGGQFILFIPDLRTAFVVTGNMYRQAEANSLVLRAVYDFLIHMK